LIVLSFDHLVDLRWLLVENHLIDKLENVLVDKMLQSITCLDKEKLGWLNVWLTKCLVDKFFGWQNVQSPQHHLIGNLLDNKSHLIPCVLTKCLSAKWFLTERRGSLQTYTLPLFHFHLWKKSLISFQILFNLLSYWLNFVTTLLIRNIWTDSTFEVCQFSVSLKNNIFYRFM
jgi:hypothetical protein